MTDEQIDQLKTALRGSAKHSNSAVLDTEILQRAKRQAEANLALENTPVLEQASNWPFISSAIALSAFAFTLTILFSLAEMTSIHEHDYTLEETSRSFQPPSEIAEVEELNPVTKPGLIRPLEQPSHALNNHTFDQSILTEIKSLSTNQLLDTMHFPIHQDRQHAAQEIGLALGEINALLNSGNLANARERYQQLRDGCQPCSLPRTLEALARMRSKPTRSG